MVTRKVSHSKPTSLPTSTIQPVNLSTSNRPQSPAFQPSPQVRPELHPVWRQSAAMAVLCETIEECWDHDAEVQPLLLLLLLLILLLLLLLLRLLLHLPLTPRPVSPPPV